MTYRPIAAVLWMCGSIASFIAMAIAGRAVAGVHDTFEIMTWRSLVGIGLVLAAGALSARLREISARRWPEHLLRNIFHFTGQNLWFWALTMIPLAQVFALEFTSPVWVILLAPLILGERITLPRAAAAVIGFLGVLIVARPDPGNISPGVLAAAASAIGFAVSILLTRSLSRKGEAVISILFWLTLMQFVMGLGMALWDGDMALPTQTTLPWLLLIGFTGVFAHFCLTRALSLAPASFVVPVDFVRLPLIALVGVALYDEPLDPLVLVGAAIIFLGNWINIRAENRTNSPQRNVAES